MRRLGVANDPFDLCTYYSLDHLRQVRFEP
jgi:hypothetical protein